MKRKDRSLIIFTCSDDGTVDRLEPLLNVEYLRINLDKPRTWTYEGNESSWRLSAQGKTVTSSDLAYAWWWKAFLNDFDLDNFLKAEIEYLSHELFHEFVMAERYLGNDFLHHEFKGKRHYLAAASGHFRVPSTLITQNGNTKLEVANTVVKSLASTPFSNKKVLYTTRVNQSEIDFANPWFIQEYIEADFDVTVQVIGDEFVSFRRKRTPGRTLDWRKEQNFSSGAKDWQTEILSSHESTSLKSFLLREQIQWGRIDFLRSTAGELVFLEFNANGQFGFLDPLNEGGLFTKVADYLSSPPPANSNSV
jgi:hypothetical protein